MKYYFTELAYDCGDGRFVRLVADDGLAQAEWVLLDPSEPGRSTTLTTEQALGIVLPEERAPLAWSALCVTAAVGGGPASLPASMSEALEAVEPSGRIRWWLRHLSSD